MLINISDVHVSLIAIKLHKSTPAPPILILNSNDKKLSTVFNIFNIDEERCIIFYGHTVQIYGKTRITSTPLLLDVNRRVEISYKQHGGPIHTLRRMQLYIPPFFTYSVIQDDIISGWTQGVYLLIFTKYENCRQTRFLIDLKMAQLKLTNTIDTKNTKKSNVKSECALLRDVINVCEYFNTNAK